MLSRTYAPSCPSGWRLDSEGDCLAPRAYAGGCKPRQKPQGFALKSFLRSRLLARDTKVLLKHDGTLKTLAECDGHVLLMLLALETLPLRARQDVFFCFLFLNPREGPCRSTCRDYRRRSIPSLEGDLAVAGLE